MAEPGKIQRADAPPPPTEAVIEWLLTGASESQVRETLAEKYPKANVDGVMVTVQQYLAMAGQPDANAVRGWALLSYRKLYQEMLRIGDFNGCRQVVKEIVGLVP